MLIHKRSAESRGSRLCGSPQETRARGSLAREANSDYWDVVTCPDCLKLQPPDTGGRTSIKRSHRAEGQNWAGD